VKFLEKSRPEGYVKIRVESRDDLWYLEQVIGKGDEVRKRTRRTKQDGREKKSVVLRLEVEKTEFQEDRLRVTGEIIKGADGVELGYHTFNIEEEDEIKLWKDFTDSEWDILEKAEKNRSYRVLFCIVEKGKADFYEVRESGIEDISKVSENIPGKMYDDQASNNFIPSIKSVIERNKDSYDAVVIAGPGFFKNKIFNALEDTENIFKKDTSVTGETGLNEAIKRGALKDVVQESRISDESTQMQDFFEQMEKEGEISYGDPVKDLAEKGAVEKLLITPEKYRENQDLVETVEQQGGEVQKIHTDHEPGERLEKLGGLAAFLRYKP
jgi:protein pelota